MSMKDSEKMIKREINFMKRKKAPKDMIKHEVSEHATMKKFAAGGKVRGTGCAVRGTRFGKNG